MTREEAKEKVIDMLLGSVAERAKWRIIETLLETSRGNISVALQLCSGKADLCYLILPSSRKTLNHTR